MLAEENIEDYVPTPELAGGEQGDYLLRVRGDSMMNVGILDGDLVVVKRQDAADDGDIVVALVGEEATVKRYFVESDHVRLQPENDSMEPIRSREVRVLGKVVGLMRSSDASVTHPHPRTRWFWTASTASRRSTTCSRPSGRGCRFAARSGARCAWGRWSRSAAPSASVAGRCRDCGATLR